MTDDCAPLPLYLSLSVCRWLLTVALVSKQKTRKMATPYHLADVWSCWLREIGPTGKKWNVCPVLLLLPSPWFPVIPPLTVFVFLPVWVFYHCFVDWIWQRDGWIREGEKKNVKTLKSCSWFVCLKWFEIQTYFLTITLNLYSHLWFWFVSERVCVCV